MWRTSAFLSVSILAMASSGCSTLIKQSYYGVKGASGKFYEVKVVDSATLTQYKRVKFAPFTSGLGEHVPEEMITELNGRAPEALAEAYLFYPEGKTLRITGNVIHYTGKSGLAGSLGNTIGGRDECVCRMQLHDDETGTLIGEAVCWGVVKSAVRRGADELGEGVGKGVAKWFEDRFGEAEVEKRRADLKPKVDDEEDDKE
jgi:hypothetical protein